MNTTYIYLNKYETGAMYVGSHTWDGPEGAVDEDYHGSSVIACKYGWVPVEVSILEVVSEERKYVAEREWILKYCNEFGVHPIVKKLHPDFGLQFKTGVLINCHSNSVECALRKAHSKEVRIKATETLKRNGKIVKWIEAGQTKESRDKAKQKLLESGKYKELSRLGNSTLSRAKALETQRRTGSLQRKLDKMHSEESYKKSSSKHNYKEIHEKRKETLLKSGNGYVRKDVVVYKDGIEVVRGSVHYCCSVLGKSSWGQSVRLKLRSSDEVEHRGFVFKLIYI